MSVVDSYCRLCQRKALEAVDLFDPSRRRLLQQIKHLTGIRLEQGENLPSRICTQCKFDLGEAYNFRVRCIEAQQYFKTPDFLKKITKNEAIEEPTEHTKGTRQSKRFKAAATRTPTPTETATPPPTSPATTPPPPLSPLTVLKEEPMDIFESEPEVDAEMLMLDYGRDMASMSSDAGNDTTPTSTPHHSSSDESEYMPPSHVKSEKSELEGDEALSDNGEKSEKSEKRARKKKDIKHHRHGSTKLPKKKREKNKTDFICDQCGKHFKHRSVFTAHMRKHSGTKIFQCELCSDAFFQQSGLTRHMNRHTGNLPIACRYCPRRFCDYSSRVRHERTHTNERPFLCTQCGKAFTQSYILKNHMLVHTGERSFKCHYCDKTFSRQTHLTTHYRAMFHKQNVEKYEQLHGKVPPPGESTTETAPAPEEKPEMPVENANVLA